MLDWVSRGPIAQRLEQQTHNLLVPGSNPGGPTKRLYRDCGWRSLAEFEISNFDFAQGRLCEFTHPSRAQDRGHYLRWFLR